VGNLNDSLGNSFGKGAWAHFVAIGGTGMGALASMLQDLGFRVTGSDGPLYPPMSVFLDSKNIHRTETYSAENLTGAKWGFADETPALVIVGNAISRGHVEAALVEDLVAQGKSVRMSFAQALAEFCIGDRESFVVCGTHGKTSTATQMAWAFESLKQSPGFFIGGIPANFSQGCRMGEGNCFISEGDEYDTAYWDKESKFLHYRPSWVLCTGIEYDHADIYADIGAIEKSFHKLILKTRRSWIVIDQVSAPRADVIERLGAALQTADRPCFFYGRAETSPYRLLGVSEELIQADLGIMGSVLKIRTPQWGEVTLKSALSGEHNALNTLGILATLLESGRLKTPAEAQAYLTSFRGVKRRQEELFLSKELIVIDDFAHHPTAIRETIKAIRKKYPQHDLAAFFEPRSATSGRNVFQKEFSECFQSAHHVYLTPPTKANIPQDQKLDVAAIKKSLEDKHIITFVSPDVNEIQMNFFKDLAKDLETGESKGRVALIMSNGSFGGLYKIMVQKASEVFGSSKPSSGRSSGQGTVEYILFMALVAFAILGLFFPIVKEKFENIQASLEANTQSVIAQDQLGIPLSWFELEGSDNLDVRLNALNGGLQGNGPTGDAPGTPPNEGTNRGPTNDGNSPTSGGDGGGGDGADGANASGGPNGSGGRSRGGASSSGGGASSSDDGGAGGSGGAGAKGKENQGLGDSGETVVEARDSNGGGDGDSGIDGGSSGDDRLENGRSEGKGAAEEEEDGDKKGELSKKVLNFNAREEEQRSGGCEKVDFSTLLKMIAVLGIIVIGAILVFTGGGGGKNSKG